MYSVSNKFSYGSKLPKAALTAKAAGRPGREIDIEKVFSKPIRVREMPVHVVNPPPQLRPPKLISPPLENPSIVSIHDQRKNNYALDLIRKYQKEVDKNKRLQAELEACRKKMSSTMSARFMKTSERLNKLYAPATNSIFPELNGLGAMGSKEGWAVVGVIGALFVLSIIGRIE